jgi:DNA polymerase I-like protein with 3'-5' exonuclease and polymerase domains
MIRLARVEPFLPSSSAHVMRYLDRMGYKIPKNRKTRRPTSNEEGLLELSRKHEGDKILPRILEARSVLKAKGYLEDTFVGEDGRFHPTYTFHPETGRLSARYPNIMNQPQGRTDAKAKLAKAIRSTIVAPPGYVLLEADWKAIEAVLVGYFADDQSYLRLSRLGVVHSYLASHLLGHPFSLSLPDADLVRADEQIKRDHKQVRDKAKKTIHARSYLEGPYAIARDLGCSYGEALRYISVFESIAPKVKKWQDETCLRAHKERGLVNPFGYPSPYYFEVFRRNAEGQLVPGKQAAECVSFLPQSSGASMLRETILVMDSILDWVTCLLLAPIHDSLLFAILKVELEQWAPTIKGLMEREWPELGGLSVGVDMKVGDNWADMSTYHA